MLVRCRSRRLRMRSHISIPVIARAAGRIPPKKMTTCHSSGIPVPS